jgi:hypothetical protein
VRRCPQVDPAGIVVAMPTYFTTPGGTHVPANVHTSVRLTIHSERLSPSEITLRLGLQPDRSHRIGEKPKPRSRHPFTTNMWSLESGLAEEASLNEHVAGLLGRLGDGRAALRDLTRDPEPVWAIIWVYHSVENWNPSLTLSHAELAAIAELGVRLTFDIYVREPGDFAPMRMPIRVPPRRGEPRPPA